MRSAGQGGHDERLTRRRLLKNLGVMGAAPVIAHATEISLASSDVQNLAPQPGRSGRERRNDNPMLHRITAGKMAIDFDRELGTVHAITAVGDALGTNFLGNQLNTRGVALGDSHWTGDVVATVWHVSPPEPARTGQAARRPAARWQREATLDSDDVRKISLDSDRFQIRYEGGSKQEGGIRSFNLVLNWRPADDHSLIWDIDIENTTGQLLEIGELALPLRADDDYGMLYRGAPPPDAERLGRTTAILKAIHEQKVLAHAFVAGHSSYVLLQRPCGDGPFLLVHCAEDTSVECIYKVAGSFAGDRIGTDLLALPSWATSQQRDWGWNPWINGHTSLILQPGQRRSFRLRFVFVEDYPAIREELVRYGNLGVRAFPQDEVRKRVRFIADQIDIEAAAGEITRAGFSRQAGRLTVQTEDSTGLVKTVILSIKGLQPGIYEIRRGGKTDRREAKGTLVIELPVAQAKEIVVQKSRTN